MRIVVRVHVVMTAIIGYIFLNFVSCLPDSRKWDPFVIAPIEQLKVDIILVGCVGLLFCGLVIYNIIRGNKE